MSGFVAILKLDGAPLDAATDVAWLEAATAAMHFRGPDAHATWHAHNIGLGHTLLRSSLEAVPATAREQQPCTLDGQVWLVADARVDDRTRLIQKLRRYGRTLQDDAPDAWLLLHAYALWGERCLDHLLGDFAFVLWDGREQRLFCGRDPAGAAAFFHARVGNTLIISNTLNVVRSYPGVSSALDQQTLIDYLLTLHYQQDDSTIFAAIRRLPKAHKLVVEDGAVRIARYWQLAPHVDYIRYRQPQMYVEHFLEVLEEAVRDRVRTATVAGDLSGGLDSPSVLVVANRLLRQQGKADHVRGATIVYGALVQEQEGKFAQQVADYGHFTTKHYAADAFMQQTPEAEPTYLEPEPWVLRFQSPNHTILQEHAHFTRMYLLGFGGDPLLSWQRVPWHQALWMGQIRSIARDVRQWLARRPSRAIAVRTLIEQQLTMLSPALASHVDLDSWFENYWQRMRPSDQQRGMFSTPLWESHFRTHEPGYTGLPLKISMPFFDLRLVDYVRRIPPDPWRMDKKVLRDAMVGLLPEQVRTRPKTPLGALPLGVLLEKEGVPRWMHDVAAYPPLREYANQAHVLQLLAASPQQVAQNIGAIYAALALAHWLQRNNLS